MRLTKLSLAMATLIGAGVSVDALALQLYVDTKTHQIYAEPGKGRVSLGEFQKVDEAAARAPAPAPVAVETDQLKTEIVQIKQDLELKANELRALDEHMAAQNEYKSKNDEKWFNKVNLRGYTQLRYNQPLSGDRVAGEPELKSVGDKSIGNNSGFFLRRVRLVFSGDMNDYISMYIQPDFATDNGDLNFAQLRDAYFDLSFDKAHEFRIRAGQSKVPFGWENLQSSQNRLTLDRADALNSAVPSERDLGLMAYWSPEDVQKLWKDLSKKGLKTSGDYGVLGVGVYNGQGINKPEANDDLTLVAHSSYPFKLNWLGMPKQVVEVGVDAISGRLNRSTSSCSASAPCYINGETITTSIKGSDKLKNNSEDRVGVHAILFPQPFGLQTEWNWGSGPTLNPVTRTVERHNLNGGYVQAMYKIDEIFDTKGTMIPYVKWQTYEGAWKGATNAPLVKVEEVEAGVEYQINKALELTLAYATMDRTNISNINDKSKDYLKQASGDMLRAQLQVNY